MMAVQRARPVGLESGFLAEGNSSTSFWHYPGALRPKIQSFVIGKEDRSIDRVSRGVERGGREGRERERERAFVHCILSMMFIQDNFKDIEKETSRSVNVDRLDG